MIRRIAVAFVALALALGLAHAKQHKGKPVLYTFDEAGWIVGGPGEISGTYGYKSSPVALSLAGNGFAAFSSAAYQYTHDMAFGKRYVVSAWLNADLASDGTPIHIDVYGGLLFASSTEKAQIGAGWQFVELGSFVDTEVNPANLYVGIEIKNIGGPVTAGRWLVDDVEIEEVEMRKWDAISSVVAAVKTINGVTDGFNIDLANRVYSRMFTPPEQPTVMLPYCCIPLDQEAETIEYEGLSFTSTWRIAGWAFLSDNPESDVLNSAGAEAAAKFRDDLLRAIMADQSLGGTAINCEVASVDTFEGSTGDPTTWVQFTISFEQIGGAADLVPA